MSKLTYAAMGLAAMASLSAGCTKTANANLAGPQAQQVNEINALLAEDPNAEVQLISQEDRIVCRRERLLGSNIPERVCRSVSSTEDAARDVRDTHRAMGRTNTGPADPMMGQRGGPGQ